MKEVRIEVTRSARYFMSATPGRHVTDVWIVCHGFAQLASRFLRRFEHIWSPTRLVVAPEALNRFYVDTSPRPHGPADVVGATWMTREDRENEIRDYVRYLDGVHDDVQRQVGHANARLLVLGFSQGAATACRWFSMGQARADHLVLCSGHLPGDLNLPAFLEKWRAAELSIVWGDADAVSNASGITRDREALSRHALVPRWIEFAGGHELNAAALSEIAASR